MSDDNKTRIITQQPKAADDQSEVATRMFSGNSQQAKDSGSRNENAHTRVITGVAEAPQTNNDTHDLAVGWIVIVEGPGKGCTKEVFYGMNSVGRDPNERIPLDFGDESISRSAHAYVVYDEKQNEFYIQHGGKSNLVRLNDAPVLSPLPIKHGDMIELGSTKLMFVPLCCDTFKWEEGKS